MVQWQDFCLATYKYNETASPPQNTTHIMHWYALGLFSAYQLDKKPNPVGYLCAQVCESNMWKALMGSIRMLLQAEPRLMAVC
jgi:hypothetical protein